MMGLIRNHFEHSEKKTYRVAQWEPRAKQYVFLIFSVVEVGDLTFSPVREDPLVFKSSTEWFILSPLSKILSLLGFYSVDPVIFSNQTA